jgi:hypothetical protein
MRLCKTPPGSPGCGPCSFLALPFLLIFFTGESFDQAWKLSKYNTKLSSFFKSIFEKNLRIFCFLKLFYYVFKIFIHIMPS